MSTERVDAEDAERNGHHPFYIGRYRGPADGGVDDFWMPHSDGRRVHLLRVARAEARAVAEAGRGGRGAAGLG